MILTSHSTITHIILSFAAFKLFQIDLSRNDVFWITLFFHPMLQFMFLNQVINEKRIAGCIYISLGSESYVNHSLYL
jgi:hypothetical protein